MTSFALALNYLSDGHLDRIRASFSDFGCHQVFVAGKTPRSTLPGCTVLPGYGIEFGYTLRELIALCRSQVLALLLKPVDIELIAPFAGWLNSVPESDSVFHYSCHSTGSAAGTELQPCIDYQSGSVRDDFDFGPLLLIDVAKARKLISAYPQLIPDDASALYGLRLASSLQALPRRNADACYRALALQQDDAHHSHFAYASSAGAASQKALEHTFTEFARIAGFLLPEQAELPDFSSGSFKYEASIIIPVRNRAGKVEHAVRSALAQKTSFKFNVIVVDNHSTDGTTDSLAELARNDSRLRHIVPERTDLGIGGCWQLAIEHQECGKFAVQLDSDDIYSSEIVLQRIVEQFYKSNAAAVVGSYLLVDRDLNEIPPGAIEHREWTDSNGHNNALRINGLGAPRAYYTPVIRKTGFPNVSYGEDYCAMLAICRSYRISRIYEHLYLCRRWEGNSDASPGIEKLNRFHFYKDGLRTAEIEARKALNAK